MGFGSIGVPGERLYLSAPCYGDMMNESCRQSADEIVGHTCETFAVAAAEY
jgi:hypothetical protein